MSVVHRVWTKQEANSELKPVKTEILLQLKDCNKLLKYEITRKKSLLKNLTNVKIRSKSQQSEIYEQIIKIAQTIFKLEIQQQELRVLKRQAKNIQKAITWQGQQGKNLPNLVHRIKLLKLKLIKLQANYEQKHGNC